MINRSLIAAAGSAGEDVSYWVARITTSPNLENSYRASVNEGDESIVVRTSTQSTANQGYIELDYDGGYQSAKTTAMSSAPSSGYQASLDSIGGNTYIANQLDYYTSRILQRESSSDTSYSEVKFNLSSSLGLQNAVAHSHFMCADDETSDDRLVMVGGGYLYFDPYYQGGFAVWTWNVTDSTIDSRKMVQGNFNTAGYGNRWCQVAKGNNQKFAVSWTDTASTKQGFATYYNGATDTFSGALYPSTSNMKTIGIGVDANDKMTCVAGLSNQVYVYRGNTAGDYTPSIIYSFSPSSIGGYPISSAIDSEGNAYILFREMYLVKFNAANQVEWTLYIDNSLTTYQSGQVQSEVKVETIGDTEFLLMSLQWPPEGSTRPAYIVKAPLDLNNYLGTYGNLQISSYSFSPTVSTVAASSSNFYGTTEKSLSSSTSSVSASSSGAGSSVTDIE